jgi:hypothetical protein
VPDFTKASISTRGMPLRPKPPTARLAPSGISAMASKALAMTLSTQTSKGAAPVRGSGESVRQDADLCQHLCVGAAHGGNLKGELVDTAGAQVLLQVG